MEKTAKIYVAGHRGLVGSALVRRLTALGYSNLLTRTRAELDLLDSKAVADFFLKEKPNYVFLAAARVGGILANKTYPADFIYENLLVQTNVIHEAHLHDVKKLLFLGSSCIYPRLAPQPMKESYLLSGELEETNRAYAIAKIAGIITCESYRDQYGLQSVSVMPTNLYGPNDNFDLERSHAFPGLIRKFHEAKVQGREEVVLWGTGTTKREFLHADDLADACIFLMNTYAGKKIVNIGTGEDIFIKDFAQMVKEVVGFQGRILWDATKPDGTPRKLLDVSHLHDLGWHHRVGLREGLEETYKWFLVHVAPSLPISEKK
ncbi:MAG: GDP-fucose synthetase [Candidatus Taylorbacteria bacterium RIFCSPHIGHO2_01_FULL_51_15]|uniref:GDP-L-fucose synthase n=1 Tax=Candidatus Taylorbacteria bacterium RIFCSPHIGHO2_01_FULL_51_15 TaxID=1802304 RepID=A0A1G2M8Z0_9BACT|nr:MAG: GDP-fucose synthetase [Candidatus Taylorbacteria bacterium RIFCSPHIGHO2_01_FULL_51_15]